MKTTVQWKQILRVAPIALTLMMVFSAVLIPASVSAAPVSQMSMPSAQYHTVRVGDTLSGIAMQYGTSMYAIMQANGIQDPNQIYVGQQLIIPSGSGSMGGGSMGGDMSGGSMNGGSMGGEMHGDMSNDVQCKTYHTVMHGETGSEIAMMYGVSTYSLAQANGLPDVNNVWGGQTLCIPAGPPPVNAPTQDYEYPKPKQMPMPEPMPMPMPEPMPMPMPMPAPMPMPEPQKQGSMQMAEPMPMPAPMPMPPMSGGCQVHQVRAGETLAQIAYAYGTSVYALMKQNGIQDPNMIYAGQVLKINCDDMGYMPMPEPMPMPMPMPEHQPMPMPMPQQQPMPMPMPEQQPMNQHPPMQGGMEMAHPMPMPMPEQQPMPMPMPAQHPMPEQGYMQASYAEPMPMPMPMPMGEPMKMSLRPQETWRGSYYCTKDLSGEPVIVRDDYDVRFNWYGGSPGEGIPEDRFSVRWERNVYFDGGAYRFESTVDDGVRVYVGEKLIIDSWREQPSTTYTADVQPPKGVHKVTVEYYEEANMASVQVKWDKYMGQHW